MNDAFARVLAMQPVSQSHLDPTLSSIISTLPQNLVPKGTVISSGNYSSDRAISSTFAGWASAFSYNGETFNGADVYVIPEVANAVIKCSIMDANLNIITSTTAIAAGTGWLSFVFSITLDSSKITGNVFYLSVEVSGHTSRLQGANITTGSQYAGSTTYKDYYTMTSVSEGSWTASVSPVGAYAVLANIKTTVLPVQSINGTKTQKIAATSTSAGTRTNPFQGFGIICNNDTNVSDFNMLKIPIIGRSNVPDLNFKWRKIVVEIRDLNQSGTLIATGTALVDPDVNPLKNVEVLLTDPTTGQIKTVTKSMLSSTYFIGYYAITPGGNAWAAEGFGTVPNYAGSSFYRTSSGWFANGSNPCMGIESWLVTNPVVVNTPVLKVAQQPGKSLIINLPPKIYALVGQEINVYFDNLINFNANDFIFDVNCSVGTHQNERWTFNPSSTGSYTLTITIYNKNLYPLATASTTVVVTGSGVGNGVNRKCLFIGDSTTAAGTYTQHLLDVFTPDVMKINLIGTIGTAPNVYEGRGGWSVNQYYTDSTSPFVFSGSFNFSQYMTTHSYSGLNYVGIHLGINDIFTYTDDALLYNAISTILANYDAIVSNIHAYDSTIKVGIMVTIPPSTNQDAFGALYGSGQSRWRYRHNLAIWIQQLLLKFGNRESSNIYLVPINVNLDTVNNMQTTSVAVNAENAATITRQNNSVHPATPGYNQMGDVMYYWLKSFEV